MHRNFGFGLVDMHDRRAVLRAALSSKKIIIGGGGLWGVDMNLNTLLLSIFLFVSRWALKKKIYLLGVGFYSSTTRMGRIGAWFAAKAADLVLARDIESVRNFRRFSRHVYQDRDIAWQIENLDLTHYQRAAEAIQEHLPVGNKTLLVALRRPQSKRQHDDMLRFNNLIRWFIQANPDKPIILAMLESASKDSGLYAQAKIWRRQHKHLRILEMPYNPLSLLTYIKRNHDRLAVIAPQLHLIMSAHLTHVPFLPIVYDNKVAQLLDQIGVPAKQRIPLAKISSDNLMRFVTNFYEGKG
jgi:polysaccharide pyruvyl transferase WcaK-like protein